jgi:uncharacterized protein (TIGR02147 family)
MAHINQFTDYREFLFHRFSEMKSVRPTFSLQYCANQLGVSKSYVKLVFDGKRHITLQSLPLYTKLFKLTAKEKMHLSFLFCYTLATNEILRRHFQLAIVEIESNRMIPPECTEG